MHAFDQSKEYNAERLHKRSTSFLIQGKYSNEINDHVHISH